MFRWYCIFALLCVALLYFGHYVDSDRNSFRMLISNAFCREIWLFIECFLCMCVCLWKKETARLILVSYFDKKKKNHNKLFITRCWLFFFPFFSFFVAVEIVMNSFGLNWAAFFSLSLNTNAEIYIRQILFLRNTSHFVVAVYICYVFQNHNQRTELIVSNKTHILRFLSFFHSTYVRFICECECKQ